MRKIIKFLRLKKADRLFLAGCLITVGIVRLGLTVSSYRFVRRWLIRTTGQEPASVEELARLAWGVGQASRFVPMATCLTQALSGQILLSRLGKASQLRVGVHSSSAGQIEAHAWLVSGDHIVLGGTQQSLQRYIQLAEFGSDA
ncbi:MAG: lasso peptide biosynthesis B2 protein [Mesorhizobium sp.]